MNMLQNVIPLSQFQQTRSPSLKRINRRVNRLSKLAKLESEEIRSVELDQSDANIILGRQNSKKTNIAFEWFDKPKVTFEEFPKMKAKILSEIENIEPLIETYFKMIVTLEMANRIAEYTNKKIKLINIENLNYLKYKEQVNRLLKDPITVDDIYAFIGILLLLGITKKSDVNVEALWSETSIHYADFAVAAMSRDRFKLIARNLTFDDLNTRKDRCNQKFYKMSEIFNIIKSNLSLINPSFSLCVDEELYAFRGLDKYFN